MSENKTSPILREVAPEYKSTNNHELDPVLFPHHHQSITGKTHTHPTQCTKYRKWAQYWKMEPNTNTIYFHKYSMFT